MIIQEYSSRFNTPRVKLSQEAYQNSGPNIFYSEKIPFAGRTSQEFARNLVRLIVERAVKISEKTFHIYELGAGTGILAKRILDLLKSNHKDLYQGVVLHATDISRPMISELKKMEDFREHHGHIIFELLDVTKPTFSHKPLFVYFTNLIDALPCRQIKIIKGQIFEVQIQTSLKRDAQIIDVSNYPPKVLNQKEIIPIIKSKSPRITRKRLLLAPQLITVFQEETRLVSINEIGNMTTIEKDDLKNLCRSKDGTGIFNYCYAIRLSILKIINEMEKGGFILISDVGVTSGNHPEVLDYHEFGRVTAFTVDFLSIKQAIEKIKTSVYVTSNTPGHPQEIFIDTFTEDKSMEKTFGKLFGKDMFNLVNDFLQKIKEILFTGFADRNAKLSLVTDLYNSLPDEQKSDYLLLNDLPLFLVRANFYQEALYYTDLLLKNYGHTAGIFYYLNRGQANLGMGNLKAAEENFKSATRYNNALAFAHLANLHLSQKKHPAKAIELVKNYLRYTEKGDYLKSMSFISQIQEKNFGLVAAKSTLKDIVKLGGEINNLSDDERKAFEQAKSKLSIFSNESPGAWSREFKHGTKNSRRLQ